MLAEAKSGRKGKNEFSCCHMLCVAQHLKKIFSDDIDPELLEENVPCIPAAACQELSLVGHVASQDANSIRDALV